MQSLFYGAAISVSLIFAIGAQNAFVLRQGLRREHVLPLVLFSAVSDALLITAGIAGMGSLSQAFPLFETVMRWGGAAFLFWYGATNFKSAWRGGASLKSGQGEGMSRKTALLTLAALTWLNPHVYLDTVVLIGSLSAQYDSQFHFGIGAALGSLGFFFCLGYGARYLSPLFAQERSWQILDTLIGLMMWGIAIGLIWH
ncbi:LysE/ArgO family amino acid transporter [Aestuariibius sp. HNIBRBA575]|uniref:LysE/ArgO family amino acid transporter n=1 Tax=Aestuariibius sp. HNIBRBA575 TaxID=3233343 RepID=UPI0034A4C02C